MNRQKFIKSLRKKLESLPNEEIDKAISYYEEIIDDEIETGKNEDEAIESLGSIEEIAKEILDNIDAKKDELLNSSEFIMKTFIEQADEISELILIDSNNPISVVLSEDENIKITYYENKYKVFNINRQNSTVSIQAIESLKRKWFFNYVKSQTTTIALPKSYSGKLEIGTSNGHISVTNIGCQAEIKMHTSNGAIKVENSSLINLDFKTSNGSVNLQNIEAENIKITTSNGRMIANKINAQNEINLKTSNGSISVDNINANKLIALSSSNGRITGTIIGSMRDFTIESYTSNGSNSLPTNLPGGTRDLKVNTSNAGININFTK